MGFFANVTHAVCMYLLRLISKPVAFTLGYVPNTNGTSDPWYTPTFSPGKKYMFRKVELYQYRHVGKWAELE